MSEGDAISEEVLTAHLDGQAVLLDMAAKRYYRLNETAAAVWKGLERGMDRAALADRLCDEFEVPRETAEAEVDRLLAALVDRRLLSA